MSVPTHRFTAHGRLLGVLALASGLFIALLGALTGPTAVYAGINPPFIAEFTAAGEGIGQNFGFDVAAAGDVDGDGVDDLLVGAPEARKVYVYRGGAGGLTHSNVITLTNPTTDTNQFGWSVASGGDVDANSVADILVGAPNGNISGTNDVGLVYVYTGSVAAPPTLAVTLTGETDGESFGWSAAILGHTDNDTFDEIAVGDWQHGISDTGRVYVYAGVSNVQNLAPTLILKGEQPNDGFGVDVAGAGDVNGDGYTELLVGAWQNDDAGPDAGKVYLYLGSATGLTETEFITLTGPDNSGFGTAVAGAGDVNGDGYADILVGADVADSDTITNTGKAYLYLGSPDGPVTPPALVLTGENEDDRFGFAVAGGGDINGDGFGDLAVGANEFDLSADPADAQAGKAYAYAGCLGGPQPTPIFTVPGELDGDNYGRSLTLAGDLNDDGVDDLVVGAFGGENDLLLPTGKFYVYYGVNEGGCRAAITLAKTVAPAQDPPVCGTTDTITVTLGQSVNYCYKIRNTGTVTLTHHFLADTAAVDPIFERKFITLTPGAEYTHFISYTPAVSITHSATWTSVITVTGPGGIPALDPETTLTATASAQTHVVVTIPIPPDEPGLLLPSIRNNE
jgi:hypothetical protein